MPNNPDEFGGEIRDAFDSYPCPTANAEFDARFWRELDARQNRYRGLSGVLRRVIEVEIEGIAVWRLGAALFGGAATCALGVALLNLSLSPVVPVQSAPQIAEAERIPSAMPRYAREFWDERGWDSSMPVAPKSPPEKPKAKEEISYVSFARDLV